jgi:hypothetical protein
LPISAFFAMFAVSGQPLSWFKFSISNESISGDLELYSTYVIFVITFLGIYI